MGIHGHSLLFNYHKYVSQIHQYRFFPPALITECMNEYAANPQSRILSKGVSLNLFLLLYYLYLYTLSTITSF